MAVSTEYRDYVMELLAPLGPVSSRAMFGGLGLYYSDTMFALVADEVLYFKVDDANRGDFEQAGAGPFEYQAKGGKRAVMAYYQVPAEVLEDTEDILVWARKAVDVALRARKPKPPRGRKRKG